MPMLQELERLGKYTLDDLAGSLNSHVSGERAMEIATKLMEPMMNEEYTPQEFLSGCVMGIMKILAATIDVEKVKAAEKGAPN